MALINCPECNKQVSDKAIVCINCGFPLSEYLKNETLALNEIEDKNIDETEESIEEDAEIAEFLDGYSITYVNGKIKILKGEDILYDGEITNIKIYEVTKDLFSDGGCMTLNADDAKIPRTLRCTDGESLALCKKMKGFCDSKKGKRVFNGIYKFDLLGNATEVYCTNCGSSNCSNYRDRVVVPEKAKKSVSLNLNPLKPFTVLNVKEKTVRKEQIIDVEKFICNNCGKIFR